MPSQSSLLTVLLTTTTLISGGLCLGLPAVAQISGQPYGSSPYGNSVRRQAANEYTVLYVNPLSGDDQFGDGTRYQPFKTITQALQAAQPGTVVLLAPGRYTTANGESFPLQLRPGITLQGQPTTTQSVLIQGGGPFSSRQLSSQNAAVVMADRSGLAYVVVSNPMPQGHGVWIESGQPVIRSSALVANEHTGLYVAGGAPTIESSYFSQNRVAGLVLYGQAQAIVRGNHFENTGTAITVADGANAEITDNRILRNDEGVVLLGNASPLIANNQIAQNRRNGVVEVALETAQPASSPLLISRVTASSVEDAPEVDAQAAAAAEVASNVEPDVLPSSSSAPVPDASAPLASSAPQPSAAAETAAIAGSPSAPVASATPSAERVTAPAQSAVQPDDAQSEPLEASAEPLPAPTPDTAAEAESALPSIAELRNRVRRREQLLSSGADGPTTSSVPVGSEASAIGSDSVDIAVIPATSSARRSISPPAPQSAQETTIARGPSPTLPRSDNPGNRLSVPGVTIPVGSGGTGQFSPPASGTGGPPAPPSRASSLGLTYRVFVDPRSNDDRDRIRQIVPDAFRTQLDGRPLMQVGAYADEATAQARQQLLRDHGFEARVEYLP